MGLSLSVLAALFLLLPGAIFFFGLSRLHSPTAPSTQLDQYFSVALAITLVASGLLHVLWLMLSFDLCRQNGCPVPDPAQMIGLLAADLTSDLGKAATVSIREFPRSIALYFTTLLPVSWLLGRLVNPLLPKRRSASWSELLRPQGAMFVWLTADMHLNGACYLFAGWVKEFSVSKVGALERVVLGYGVRRPLVPANGEAGVSLGNGWIEIPGEFVVLQMAEAKTINLDYFYPDIEGDEPDAAGQMPDNDTSG